MNFKSHIGLDIGSYSVKLAQLMPAADGKFSLAALGQAELPVTEASANREATINVIKTLVNESKTSVKQVVVSLPESQVYTRVAQLPYMDDNELASAIRWQAEQYIPVPLEDVMLRYQVLAMPEQRVPGSKMDVLLVAAPNDLVTSYLSMVQAAGMEVVAMESEILAVCRSLLAGQQLLTVMLLIHFGAKSTSMAILNKGKLVLVQTISSGGDAITRAVASEMGLERRQAEEYKKSYGLDVTKLGGRLATVVKPVMDVVISETKRVLAFYTTKGGVEPVKSIVLSGGGAVMPGIVEYLAVNLGLEVSENNPFGTVTLSEQQKGEIGSSGPAFAAALGLAEKLV